MKNNDQPNGNLISFNGFLENYEMEKEVNEQLKKTYNHLLQEVQNLKIKIEMNPPRGITRHTSLRFDVSTLLPRNRN